MEDKILIGRESLAKRWDVKIPTITKYENEGVITRVPGIPSPRYHMSEILRIEGTDCNPLSPLERRRLEREIEIWKNKYSKINEVIQKTLPELISVSTIN